MPTQHLPDDALPDEFGRLVNMPAATLRKWLQSEDSKAVGMTKAGEKVTSSDDGESVGHHMGECILALQAKKSFDADDLQAMRKVIGYVHRHSKQRPTGDVSDTRWRKSLMNWGHDPLK